MDCHYNGQIEFTYEEAKKELGIDKKTFTRAIDELILKGFIDIVHQGGGLCRGKNLYSISDRWQLYGTDKFIEKHREKRKRIYGYIDKKL